MFDLTAPAGNQKRTAVVWVLSVKVTWPQGPTRYAAGERFPGAWQQAMGRKGDGV